MKKHLKITVILVFLAVTESLAQSSKWTFGLKPMIGLTGSTRKYHRDVETTFEFQRRVSYGAGLRLGYRISDYLSVTIDAEWQLIRDRRISESNILIQPSGLLITNTTYNHDLHRIQTPIALNFTPVPNLTRTYVSLGIMPSRILKGRVEFELKSNMPTGMIESGSLDMNFDIPANKGKDRDLNGFVGVGIPLTKRFTAEFVYQFNNPIEYSTFDPGKTFVLVPVFPIRANQSMMLSFIARIN